MKKVAVLIENQFDEKELIYPYFRLLEAGYEVDLIGTEKYADYVSKSGYKEKSTHASKDVSAKDYDAVVIPGGFSPDYMRRCDATLKFVVEMDEEKKPIATICHGGWMLASCCDLRSKKVTCYHSIKDDLINAGGIYVDEPVVISDNLIMSRTPKDLPVFMKAVIEMIERWFDV